MTAFTRTMTSNDEETPTERCRRKPCPEQRTIAHFEYIQLFVLGRGIWLMPRQLRDLDDAKGSYLLRHPQLLTPSNGSVIAGKGNMASAPTCARAKLLEMPPTARSPDSCNSSSSSSSSRSTSNSSSSSSSSSRSYYVTAATLVVTGSRVWCFSTWLPKVRMHGTLVSPRSAPSRSTGAVTRR